MDGLQTDSAALHADEIPPARTIGLSLALGAALLVGGLLAWLVPEADGAFAPTRLPGALFALLGLAWAGIAGIAWVRRTRIATRALFAMAASQPLASFVLVLLVFSPQYDAWVAPAEAGAAGAALLVAAVLAEVALAVLAPIWIALKLESSARPK